LGRLECYLSMVGDVLSRKAVHFANRSVERDVRAVPDGLSLSGMPFMIRIVSAKEHTCHQRQD
jgi:hypothetical protein